MWQVWWCLYNPEQTEGSYRVQTWKSEVCDDAFTTENKLKDHEEIKHETLKNACDKCDDEFTTQNKLNDHEKLKFGQSTSCKATWDKPKQRCEIPRWPMQ